MSLFGVDGRQMKVAYFTNIAPHYRKKLWVQMLHDSKIQFHFFFGRSPANGIREMDFQDESGSGSFLARLHQVRNVRVGSVLIFQFGVISRVLTGKWDAIILLGDMYVISNWIAALINRLKGKRTYFWGHGLYGNEGRVKFFIRKLFFCLADAHFLYGHYAKHLMERQGFESSTLHVVYNSLDYHRQKLARESVLEDQFFIKRKYFSDGASPVLIFIGRLTAEKKIDLLLHAVQILGASGTHVNVLIIGEGKERSRLEQIARSLKGQVYFYGACYDEYEIGRLLGNADLCVSPGNVGLTAIHSLSFGTPVCTHDDMTVQMPEAESIVPGKTGICYNLQKGNLAEVILSWISAKLDREQVRKNCYETIDNRYNPNVQVNIFREVILQFQLSGS